MKADQTAALQKQDGYFRSNIYGLAEAAAKQGNPRFTSFFDERQQEIAQEILVRSHVDKFLFWGGTEGCERVILGVFPSWDKPDSVCFPISALKITPKGGECPSHRDYLGSLMALRIKREAIGDIVAGEGGAVVFVAEQLALFVLQNLDRIGRASVTVEFAGAAVVERKRETRELSGSISSPRLDCVAALMLHKSRGDAAELIRAGLVKVNCFEETNVSRKLTGGDVLSVRGSGKFILGKEWKTTKKDRIFITVSQLL